MATCNTRPSSFLNSSRLGSRVWPSSRHVVTITPKPVASNSSPLHCFTGSFLSCPKLIWRKVARTSASLIGVFWIKYWLSNKAIYFCAGWHRGIFDEAAQGWYCAGIGHQRARFRGIVLHLGAICTGAHGAGVGLHPGSPGVSLRGTLRDSWCHRWICGSHLHHAATPAPLRHL